MENDRNTLNTLFLDPTQTSLRPRWIARVAKRALDILVAAFGLLLLAPFFAFIGVLIKRESPGPVFYSGQRSGKDGRVFPILKFRTMREEPASYAGPAVTAQDDPRLTRLGAWLRDTKLNELPQLWNVLVGEMSLVGPRPEDPAIVATWPEDARREILSVRPGITGPASIAYHDEEKRLKVASVMADYLEQILPDKLRLDQLYVRHHSFLTDLDALFWTFVVLVPRLYERPISEGWLFGGPLTRALRKYVNWLLIDFVVAFASLGMAGALWRLRGPLDIGLWRSVSLAVVLAFTFGVSNVLLGLKNVVWSRAAAEDVWRLMLSCGLVTLALLLLQAFFLPGAGLPSGFLFSAGALVLAGFIAVRYRLRLVTGLASRWITLRKVGYGAGERALIVGAGAGGEFAAWLLNRAEFRPTYTAVGLVDDHPAVQGMRLDGLKVLGTVADIPALVQRHGVSVIFYAINRASEADRERILAACNGTGARLVLLSEVMDGLHRLMAPGLELPEPTEQLASYPVEVER